MKKKFFIFGLICFSGCASHTGVVSIGKDTYMIARQAATGFGGLGNIKADLITEASNYCKDDNKELQLQREFETEGPYILGNYPRAEIQFMCLDKSDPQFGRPKALKPPDKVIEVINQPGK